MKLPLDLFVLYLQLEGLCTLFPHNNCVCFAYYCIVVQHLQVIGILTHLPLKVANIDFVLFFRPSVPRGS